MRKSASILVAIMLMIMPLGAVYENVALEPVAVYIEGEYPGNLDVRHTFGFVEWAKVKLDVMRPGPKQPITYNRGTIIGYTSDGADITVTWRAKGVQKEKKVKLEEGQMVLEEAGQGTGDHTIVYLVITPIRNPDLGLLYYIELQVVMA